MKEDFFKAAYVGVSKQLNKLEMKVDDLEVKNSELSSNVHILQQQSFHNDVVMSGVNLTANETHKELVQKVILSFILLNRLTYIYL